MRMDLYIRFFVGADVRPRVTRHVGMSFEHLTKIIISLNSQIYPRLVTSHLVTTFQIRTQRKYDSTIFNCFSGKNVDNVATLRNTCQYCMFAPLHS